MMLLWVVVSGEPAEWSVNITILHFSLMVLLCQLGLLGFTSGDRRARE